MAARDRRGQTAQDFALGMAIFLVCAAFVFAFLPTIAGSFGSFQSADAPVADRVARQVFDNLTAERPYVVDADRAATYFAALGSNPSTVLPVAPSTRVNITVQNATATGAITVTGPSGPQRLAAGPAPDGADTTTQRRVVRMPGVDACDPNCVVEVAVW